MINPNKSYKQKQTGTVVKIDPEHAYIPYIHVELDGRVYEGSLSRSCEHPERLKVGDRVRIELQWSIMADKPMISSVVKVRAKTKEIAI